MFPETICDFSSDISLSTSTLDFVTYIWRSIADEDGDAEQHDDRATCPSRLPESAPSKTFFVLLIVGRLVEKVSGGAGVSPCRAAFAWYSRFETFFLTSAMSSSAFWVRPFSQANAARPMMPVIRPKAVQFIASEMPFESRVAFCDGSTPATPANDLMRPVMVPEQAGEGRQVAEHRQVAGPLLELRQLAQARLFHRRGDLLVGAVGAHQARLDDAGQRRRVARADLDRALDVAGGDLRAEKSHQLFLVDDGAAQEHGALDEDRHA